MKFAVLPITKRSSLVSCIALLAWAFCACDKKEEEVTPAAEAVKTVTSGSQPDDETSTTTSASKDDDDSTDGGDTPNSDGDDDQSEVPLTLAAGDIVVMREETGSGIGDAGQLMVFSKVEGFKGYAYDPSSVVPWYSYGLKLSFDYFSDKYYLEVGSSDANLAISVRRFPWIQPYPHTLGAWTEGPASDALYFQGAFSEEYNTVRYVAVNDGSQLDVYASGQGRINDCTVSMPSGQHARAFFAGTQSFVYNPFVAYTIGTGVAVTGYGVAKLNGSCASAGGTPVTVVDQFSDTSFADAKITNLLHVRTQSAPGSDSWRGDIFITAGAFLYGQYVTRWHYDTGTTTWSEMASPFQTTAYAIYQDHFGDIYTLEEDGSGAYIRRYSVEETNGTHFIETVYTDASKAILRRTSLGNWMVVMPELP